MANKNKLVSGSALVVLFMLSQLIICLHAVPLTRTSRLDHQMNKVPEVENLNAEKMTVDINDYPGSGANNRHTPKPPQRCSDC